MSMLFHKYCNAFCDSQDLPMFKTCIEEFMLLGEMLYTEYEESHEPHIANYYHTQLTVHT